MAAFSYLVMGTIGATFPVDRHRSDVSDDGHAQHGRHGGTSRRTSSHSPERSSSLWLSSSSASASKLAVFPAPSMATECVFLCAAARFGISGGSTATKVAFYLLDPLLLRSSLEPVWFSNASESTCSCSCRSRSAAMFVGSIAAIYQTDFKRLLAYSSIAQIGYMTLGLSLATRSGRFGGIDSCFQSCPDEGSALPGCRLRRVADGWDATSKSMRGLGQRMPLDDGRDGRRGIGTRRRPRHGRVREQMGTRDRLLSNRSSLLASPS